jgi:(E)-4-hydroxy-3-methylbut-2-enyl-diphosphate synthase
LCGIRLNTIEINVAGLKIGGGSPVSVQSMTNTDTRDVDATVAQILRLEDAGCELVRVAVPDMAAAEAIAQIKRRIRIPIAADIHFDYRLAICAVQNGADKLRINPGNIVAGAGDSVNGDADDCRFADYQLSAEALERIRMVANAAKQRGVPIRIGVNSGSLERDILHKHGGVTAEGLVESVMRHVRIMEGFDFGQLVLSIKSSSVPISVAAYDMLAKRTNYPLHVGITEAGFEQAGIIKSAVGIGAILSRGIGDTIRVSLTGDPVEEIRCGREILKSLGLRAFGPVIISCPTCGRTEIDLARLAAQVQEYCANLDKNITVAVMGCVVNGPGEAGEADVGIAGGKGCGLVFKSGKILRKVPESELLSELVKEIESL